MKIGFVGAGQMASALARGFVASREVSVDEVWASDCFPGSRETFAAALPGAHVGSDNPAVVREADVVFLAVKPQSLPGVLAELRPVPAEKLFVSIAAGVSLASLVEGLSSQRVIRVMPNTPCLVGHGASAFAAGAAVTAENRTCVERLLNTVGRCWEVAEPLLDAVTGLSGSGPAYVFQFIEALSDGGVLAGLPRQLATALAAQTVLGAAQMVLGSSDHPATLKDRVASPAGTTIAGLLALENGGLRGTVMQAVQAATNRSRELGQISPASPVVSRPDAPPRA
jgi:pyrroline-5-carboxylate reductase